MVIDGPNKDSADYWESASGLSWIENEADMDKLLGAVTEKVIEVTGFKPGDRVLDVGCGTGAHALSVAQAVVPGGSVLALDISAPLLERTGARAAAAGLPIETRHADAQIAEFSRPFDVATSRFGVMFFADPASAFANIARALKPDGRMVFAAWAPVAVNPWWALPLEVASNRLGHPPPTPPNAPGPMGLADKDYVRAEMQKAGLRADISEIPVVLRHEGGARGMAALAARVGPAARVIDLFDGTSEDALAIEEALSEALAVHEDDAGLALPAMLNMIDVRVS